MAKTAETDATVKATANELQSQGFTITPEVLALISAAVASAVKESKRDEKEEARLAKEEADRQMVRMEEEERLRQKKLRQDNCPHLDAYENFAFVGQRNCMGQVMFLCTQCCKPFLPGDPEYANYARYVKYEKLGAARM